MNGYGAGSECTSGSNGRSPKRRWLIWESWASQQTRLTSGAIPDWDIGVLPEVRYWSVPLQIKDSQQRDTLASSTTTSPCTYAVEPPCTGRYARWCERSALYLGEPPTRLRLVFLLLSLGEDDFIYEEENDHRDTAVQNGGNADHDYQHFLTKNPAFPSFMYILRSSLFLYCPNRK